MKDVLQAVDYGRTLRTFDDINDALQTEQVGAAVLRQGFEKERQRNGLDRRGAHDRVGFDFGIVVVVRMFKRLWQP